MIEADRLVGINDMFSCHWHIKLWPLQRLSTAICAVTDHISRVIAYIVTTYYGANGDMPLPGVNLSQE
jgi:hypothetical protein